jgi:hypothetical protein
MNRRDFRKIAVYLILIGILALMTALTQSGAPAPAESTTREVIMPNANPAMAASVLPDIPLIDKAVPAIIETASFGLG